MIFGIFVLLAPVVTKRTGLPQKIDFTSLFVCVYRVFAKTLFAIIQTAST